MLFLYYTTKAADCKYIIRFFRKIRLCRLPKVEEMQLKEKPMIFENIFMTEIVSRLIIIGIAVLNISIFRFTPLTLKKQKIRGVMLNTNKNIGKNLYSYFQKLRYHRIDFFPNYKRRLVLSPEIFYFIIFFDCTGMTFAETAATIFSQCR